MSDGSANDRTRRLLGLAWAESTPEARAIGAALADPSAQPTVVLRLEQLINGQAAPAPAACTALEAAIARLARQLGVDAAQGDAPRFDALDTCLLTLLAEEAPEPWSQQARLLLLDEGDDGPGPQVQPDGDPASQAAPRVIGRYVLGDPLGVGGSGVVYRARHLDSGHPAAVKLLRLDAASPDAIKRFRNEARIAGSLDHPGLVRVLDSGVHDENHLSMPWLAAELVEGQTLRTYTREQSRTRLLGTFAAICDAIAHAHQRGVVHRDLKPQNVLIDAFDRPRVVDFGIAKLLDNVDGTTRSGLLMGTPAYMAPEVAQRGAVAATTASDVWSLGAMLFELIAGRTPHQFDGLSQHEALRRAAEADSPRLESLVPDVPRDLAAVVATALAPEPERRYASAAGLRDDVQRLLAGLPVSARSPRLTEDLLRFVRRHRTAALSLLLTVTALIVGGTVAVVQWSRARSAEHEQAQEAEKARAATLRSFEALSATTRFAAELGETTSTSRRVLELLATPLELLAQVETDDQSEHRRLLRLEADLRTVAGDAALRLRDLATVQTHRERLLAIEQELAGPDAATCRELANARVRLGDLFKSRGQYAAAYVEYDRAHAVFVARSAAAPTDVTALDDLTWSLERCANILALRGEMQPAITIARERIRLTERLLALRDDAQTRYAHATAIEFWLQKEEHNGGRLTAAHRAMAEQAVQSMQLAISAAPERRTFRLQQMSALAVLARVLVNVGDTAGAEQAFAEAIEHGNALRVLDPSDADYAVTTAYTLIHHADLLARSQAWPAAEAKLEEAIVIGDALMRRSGDEAGRLALHAAARSIAAAHGDDLTIARWNARYEDVIRQSCSRPGHNWAARLALGAWEVTMRLQREPATAEVPGTGADRLHRLALEMLDAGTPENASTDLLLRAANTLRTYGNAPDNESLAQRIEAMATQMGGR